ncbi:MAG: DMT family transporter [Armatimonadota bacterium]|nr:DMT family transporter [Armatimonadota bacterium]
MSAPDSADSRHRASAELGMIGVVLIWGTNFTITKASLAYIPPLAFTAVRFVLATLALMVLIRILEPGQKISSATFWKLTLIGLIGNTLYQPAWIVGLDHTTASNSAVIIGSLPGVVALLAWVFRIEKLSPLITFGIVLSLAGVFLVVGAHGISIGGSSTRGDLMTVGAVFCWAVYTLSLRRIDPDISPLRVTAVTTAMGTPGIVAMAVPELLATKWQAVPAAAYGGIVYAAFISLVGAYLLFNTGVKRLGASRASVFSCFIPLVGVLIAWAFLDEVPLPLQALGAAMVIGGVWLTRKR